jgi:hypothetical protein
MGSTRRSKFSRARRARPSDSSETKTILYEVLDHFSKVLSIVETTARAFEAAENDGQCSGAGAEVATLRQSAIALRAVHEEFDLAIAKVSP